MTQSVTQAGNIASEVGSSTPSTLGTSWLSDLHHAFEGPREEWPMDPQGEPELLGSVYDDDIGAYPK